MKILILDNYDSFTYNLVHVIREIGYDYDVVLNDKILLKDVSRYDKILISPGPGVPDDAGIMKDIIRAYGPSKSILGICLGYQGIAEVYGAKLYNISSVLHGVTSMVHIKDREEKIFKDIPDVFEATHYHSWAVTPGSLTADLEITCENENGLIMGIRHTSYDVHGLQFHPESIMTTEGEKCIKNWLDS